jgi:hypothetical protein
VCLADCVGGSMAPGAGCATKANGDTGSSFQGPTPTGGWKTCVFMPIRAKIFVF